MEKQKNIALIDGQNLHLGTASDWWYVDLYKFRVYLRDKFNVVDAYYFLGCINDEETDLYDSLQKAWFIVSFREHSSAMIGKKKGNVDVDIVFEAMKKLVLKEEFDQFVLVSWDGDYFKMVKFLIKVWRFRNILFPNKKYSSLYNSIRSLFGVNIWVADIRRKIEYTKKEVS